MSKQDPFEDSVDPERRAFLEKLVQSTAFSVPLAVGMSVVSAQAKAEEAQSQSDGGGEESGGEAPPPAGSESGGGASSESSESGGGYIMPPIASNDPPVGVPIPTSLPLLAVGVAGMTLIARRRKLMGQDAEADTEES